MQDSYFSNIGNRWIKINIRATTTSSELVVHLKSIPIDSEEERLYLERLSNALGTQSISSDTKTLLEIENYLWPIKIVDIDIPCFIVPVQPRWAMHLFEERLAGQTLLGATPEIALADENVYYRARRPRVLSAPGRILWYVSFDSRYRGSKHIRACSKVDEVSIDKPKALFKRYRRLGIYEWKHVYETAKEDINQEIMGIAFSGTELLKNPVAWSDLQIILEAYQGRRSPIQSPVQISRDAFVKIYKLASEIQ